MSICRAGLRRSTRPNWSRRRSRPACSNRRPGWPPKPATGGWKLPRLRRLRSDLPSRVLPAILKPQEGRSLAIGFYVNWGESGEASFASLKRDLKQLDWVMPSWLTLDGPDLAFKTNLDRRSLNYMRANKPGVAILPVLQNATGGQLGRAGTGQAAGRSGAHARRC